MKVRFQYEETQLLAVNIYAPNSDEPQFFIETFQKLEPFKNSLLMGGDFNLVMDISLDKQGGQPITHFNSQQVVKNFLNEYQLVDIWRTKNEKVREFTWQRGNIKVRLDFFLLSACLAQLVNQTEISDSFEMSDHKIISLQMQLLFHKKGKGVWKLNTSLLRDKAYINAINQIIEDQMLTEFRSHSHRWEVIKLMVRTESIRYSIFKNIQRNEKLLNVEEQLKNLNRPEYQPLSEAQKRLRTTLIEQREEILNYKVEGAILRSKIDWAHAGNKPSKYFFSLEKTKYSRRIITRLTNQQGQIQTTTPDLLQLMHQYYADLYQSRDEDFTPQEMDDFFRDLNTNQLSLAQKTDLDSPIQQQELNKAVVQMKDHKTPGPDGLPIEFYKTFWEKLRKPFEAMTHQVLEQGFPVDMLRSITTLLGKKDRDPLWLDNWRPISLLNSDYKIIAKTFVNRLNKVLPDIIDLDQKGFVKGRYIGENLLELISLIELCDKQNIPAFFISCDCLKAFDSCSHAFYDRCLQQLGFGEMFRKYMRNMYTNMEASILNNGHLTPRIKISRGFRQGDPLSSINFIIMQQILIAKLKYNNQITGIHIANTNKFIGLFADDMWAILAGTQQNLSNFLQQLEAFKISGLTLNYDKTQIMRVGSLRDSDAQFYTQKPLNWIDPYALKGIRVLGVNVGTKTALESNYDDLLANLDKIIHVWQQRNLNIMGKIVLINSLMMSITVYKILMTVFPPEEFSLKFKQKILRFLWDDKPPRIRYSKIILSKEDGGMNLIDLQTKNKALKASWVARIIKNDQSVFSELVYANLPIKQAWIWECNITSQSLYKLFPSNLWIQIWASWADFSFTKPDGRDSVMLQVLWYNEEIYKNNQPWISNDLMLAGIIRLQDIVDENTDQLLNYPQACQRFNQRLNVMHYNALLQSIPRHWKQLLHIYIPLEPTLIDFIHKKPKMASFLYHKARNKFIDHDGCREAWRFDLGIPVTIDEWNQVITNVHKISTQTELTLLQYRIIHRILTTNNLRHKWDSRVGPQCQFCDNSIETVIHLMCECVHVAPIWKFVQKWLRKLLRDVDLELDNRTILFNDITGPDKTFANTVLLVIKRYIYSSKCQNVKPTVNGIMPIIIKEQRVEKMIATRTNRMKQYLKKWNVFLAWLYPP